MVLWVRVALLEMGIAVMYFLVRTFFPHIMREEKQKTAKAFKWIGVALFSVHAIGIFCNIIAFTANGGKMPTDPASMERAFGPDACADSFKYDTKHICADVTTRVPFLIDRFYFRSFSSDVWSIGDILGHAGLSALVLFVISFWSITHLRDWRRKHSP